MMRMRKWDLSASGDYDDAIGHDDDNEGDLMTMMVIIMISMTRMMKMECGDLGPSGEVTPVVDDCEVVVVGVDDVVVGRGTSGWSVTRIGDIEASLNANIESGGDTTTPSVLFIPVVVSNSCVAIAQVRVIGAHALVSNLVERALVSDLLVPSAVVLGKVEIFHSFVGRAGAIGGFGGFKEHLARKERSDSREHSILVYN